MEKQIKKVWVPPIGYAYLQEDGSWVIPGKEQGLRWNYTVSDDGKVITMTPVDETPYNEK